MKRPASRGQAIFLGTTEPRAARPEGYRHGGDASRPRVAGGVKRSVKYADVDARLHRAKNLDMTIVEITGGMLRAARSLAGLSQRELADRAMEKGTPGERVFADAFKRDQDNVRD
jgi:ribosome-binding protein aMBF1 (putative translation factor)